MGALRETLQQVELKTKEKAKPGDDERVMRVWWGYRRAAPTRKKSLEAAAGYLKSGPES